MTDQEPKQIIQREYWLNPSIKDDGIYRIHANYTDKKDKWKYSKYAPQSLSLDKKIVYYHGSLTEEESLEYSRNKDQIDKKVRFIKDRNIIYKYIGDTEPVAIGISAFFIKKSLDVYASASSLLSIIERRESVAIYSWYEEYYEKQFAAEREINEAKTLAQGRLTAEQLSDTFNRNHLHSEQDYFRKSEEFFNIILTEDEQTANIMREYVKGYLAWVKEKIKHTIRGYIGSLSPEKLKSLYNRLLEKKILKEGNILVDDFVKVFTGEYFTDCVVYKGKKSELARIIIAIMGEVIVEDVNKIFVFPNTAPFDSNNKNVDAGIVRKELNSL